MRKRLEFERQLEIDILKEEFEKKKKKDEVEFDESSVQLPRLPEDLIWQVMRRRLLKNDCKFRGFVLDGYPRTYLDC